jgi:CheY-like chemotaxis protein
VALGEDFAAVVRAGTVEAADRQNVPGELPATTKMKRVMTSTELEELDARVELECNPAGLRRRTIELTEALAEVSLRGSETVLIVDDEPLVREVMTDILRSFGYRVLVAAGALEAQRLIGAGEKINLLLTDFSMPETNGLELAHWFQRKNPGTKVLITTGSLWELENQIGEQEPVAILPKPFDYVELGRMVRLALE